MIDWSEFFLVAVPLAAPELLAASVALLLLLRRGWQDRTALLWVLIPIATLGVSTLIRFLPIFVNPLHEWLDALLTAVTDPLYVVLYGDMLLRLLSWAALIYGLFWKLPSGINTISPLDPKTTQTAATAALLAILLTEQGAEATPPNANA